MASIRNSISLQDQMTPVFRSIMRSMDSTLKVMRDVDRQANRGVQSKAYMKAEGHVSDVNKQIDEMNKKLKQSDKDANKFSSTMGGISGKMSGLSKSGFNLLNLSSALYLIKNIGKALEGVMSAPDEGLSTKARLGLFNESQYSPEQLYGQVYKTALNTRTGLAETGNLATRILISGAMTGEGSATGAIKVTDIINKALVAGGGTSDENRRALLQLSQGLASGTLQGDELRAIREQTPYLAKVLAEGLGKVDGKFAGASIGDLKELGKEGELTAERILKAFLGMEDEINAAFDKMPRTFGQSMTQLGTIWQYFLYMLGQGDGALAKINEKVWELADYLSSEAGIDVLEKIAMVITMVADAVLWGVDVIAAGIGWLLDNMDVLKTALITIAIISIASATSSAIAWLSAAWPILLVMAIVGGLIYMFYQLGYSTGEILGAIAGGFMFLAYTVWDVIIGIMVILAAVGMFLWNVFIAVGTGLILLFQLVMQVIMWVVLAIWTVLVAIYDVFYSVFYGAIAIVKYFIIGVAALFVGLGNSVLGVLWAIAAAIDAVFGSSLAGTVKGWMDSLTGNLINLEATLNPTGDFEKIGDQWKNSFTDVGALFGKDSEWNIMGKLDDTINAGNSLITDPSLAGAWGDSLMKNPMDGWDKGYDFGAGLGNKIDNYDYSLGNIEDILGDWDMSSVKMNGGSLDNVGDVGNVGKLGKIDSNVSIDSEDLKLLRDMAAREFLLNLQTITPVAQVTFGDVRETADVNAIMDVIEEMVEEQLATSLVE